MLCLKWVFLVPITEISNILSNRLILLWKTAWVSLSEPPLFFSVYLKCIVFNASFFSCPNFNPLWTGSYPIIFLICFKAVKLHLKLSNKLISISTPTSGLDNHGLDLNSAALKFIQQFKLYLRRLVSLRLLKSLLLLQRLLKACTQSKNAHKHYVPHC